MKLKLFLALLLFPVSLMAQIAEEEPNDEAFQAQNVSPNDFIEGYGTPFDVDYFKLELEQFGSLSVEIIELSGAQILSVQLRNNQDATMTGVQQVFDAANFGYTCMAPGTYYIQVGNGPIANGAYGIQLTFTEISIQPTETPFNSNNTLENASFLPVAPGLNSHFDLFGFDTYENPAVTRDDEDYWMYVLPEKGKVTVENFSYEEQGAAFANMSHTILSKSGLGIDWNVTLYECVDADTIIVRVTDAAFTGATQACYDYSYDLEFTPLESDAQDGDDYDDDIPAMANTFPEGETTVEGVLGYVKDVDGQWVKDEIDWWRFPMPESGDIVISGTFSDPMYGDINIVDENGDNIPGGQYEVNNFSEVVWSRDCNSDQTEIFVEVNHGGYCGVYNLEVSFNAALADADDSGNDDFENAQSIAIEENLDGQLGFRDECGQGCFDHQDYFSFEWEDAGSFQVVVEKEGELYPSFTLYEPFQDELLEVPPIDIVEDLPGMEGSKIYTYECINPGTFFPVFSDNVNGFGCGYYHFSVNSLFDSSEYDDGEEEDELYGGKEISDGQNTGVLGFDDDEGNTDVQDNWYVEMEESGSLKIKVTAHEGLKGDEFPNIAVSYENFIGSDISASGETLIYPDSIVWESSCLSKQSLVRAKLNSSPGECGWYEIEYDVTNMPAFEAGELDNAMNNNLEQAVTLAMSQEVRGELGYQNECGSGCRDEIDYYKVEWDRHGSLVFLIESESNIADEVDPESLGIEVYRLDSEGNWIAESPSFSSFTGNSDYPNYAVILDCRAPGDYAIGISVPEDASCTSYKLRVNDSYPFIDESSEPNDSFGNSETIVLENDYTRAIGFLSSTESGLESDVVDYYNFQLNEAGRVNIQLLAFNEVVDAVGLHRFTGEEWEAITAISYELLNSGPFEVGCLEAGSYALIVTHSNSVNATCGNYNLRIEAENLSDTGEDNDTEQNATPLAVNQSINAAIGYLKDGGEDTVDHYVVDLDNSDQNTIFINRNAYGGNIDLQLYNQGFLIYDEGPIQSVGTYYSVPENLSGELIVRISKSDQNGADCLNYSIELTGSSNSPDINLDGLVNMGDLIELLGSYGCTNSCGGADINGDGLVNTGDITLMLGQYGTYVGG